MYAIKLNTRTYTEVPKCVLMTASHISWRGYVKCFVLTSFPARGNVETKYETPNNN